MTRGETRVSTSSTPGRGAGNGTVVEGRSACLRGRRTRHDLCRRTRRCGADPRRPGGRDASAALCGALVAVADGGDGCAAALNQTGVDGRLAKAVALVEAGDLEAVAELAGGSEGGTCWATLAAGLGALTFDDYARGVSWAIGIGFDTDTNGAVAGALLGARGGVDGIPARRLDALRDRERNHSRGRRRHGGLLGRRRVCDKRGALFACKRCGDRGRRLPDCGQWQPARTSCIARWGDRNSRWHRAPPRARCGLPVKRERGATPALSTLAQMREWFRDRSG
jgi:hypothetical protein